MVLLMVLLYVFGIFFKTQMEQYPASVADHFSSVSESMWILLMDGTILDNPSKMLNELRLNCGFVMTTAFLLFILLSFFTLMNMLIGILCEVVFSVKQSDKREAEIAYLQLHMGEILECYDKDDDAKLGPEEFDLLMKNPEVHDTLHKFGTDARGLLAMHEAGLMFPDDVSLSFSDFIRVIMQLKGQKTARVADVVDMRKYIAQRWDHIDELAEVLRSAALGAPGRPSDCSPQIACPRPETGAVGSNMNALKAQLADIVRGQRELSLEVEGLRSELHEVKELVRAHKLEDTPPSCSTAAEDMLVESVSPPVHVGRSDGRAQDTHPSCSTATEDMPVESVSSPAHARPSDGGAQVPSVENLQLQSPHLTCGAMRAGHTVFPSAGSHQSIY